MGFLESPDNTWQMPPMPASMLPPGLQEAIWQRFVGMLGCWDVWLGCWDVGMLEFLHFFLFGKAELCFFLRTMSRIFNKALMASRQVVVLYKMTTRKIRDCRSSDRKTTQPPSHLLRDLKAQGIWKYMDL